MFGSLCPAEWISHLDTVRGVVSCPIAKHVRVNNFSFIVVEIEFLVEASRFSIVHTTY